MKSPAAFISYARRDDRAYSRRITGIRERLQGLVGAAIGWDFEIFQDCEGIAWGQHWRSRLAEALDEALFLIPILTPSYFNSEACRAELEAFLELERRSGRKDRILSLYFLNAPVYEKKADPLAAILQQRQHRDWRHLLIDPLGSPKVMRALDSLAKELAAAIYARQPDVSPLAAAPQPSAGGAAIQHSAPTAQQEAATEQAPAAPVERSRMARNYLSALPKRVAQLQIEAERRRLAENQRSREIQEITEFVSRTLADLVKTFSSEGAKIVFTDCQFPQNIFSPDIFR
jgi:hypothetical protein